MANNSEHNELIEIEKAKVEELIGENVSLKRENKNLIEQLKDLREELAKKV